MNAIIVDVDGTLVDVSTVRHHVLNRPKDFDAFHREAETCPPIYSTVDLVAALAGHYFKIIIVTARMRRWQASTTKWLMRHHVNYDELHMRADDDHRPDYEIKREILADIRTRHDVILAIDDNPAVVALWRSEGIPTIEVPGWAEET